MGWEKFQNYHGMGVVSKLLWDGGSIYYGMGVVSNLLWDEDKNYHGMGVVSKLLWDGGSIKNKRIFLFQFLSVFCEMQSNPSRI